MRTLSAKNIVLRPFEAGDTEEFAAAVRESESTVGEWLPWWKPDFSAESAVAWIHRCSEAIASRTAFDIGVFEKSSGLLLGSVAINRIEYANRIGSIGYWTRQSQQGKGHCTEAVKRMAAFGFEELELCRLEIVILKDNLSSRRVAEKCGATLECVAMNRLVHNGRPSAAAVYSLLSDS